MNNKYFEEFEKEMLAFANATTEVQSLLYDLDLMPEQIKKGSSAWGKMLNISHHMYLYGKRISQSEKGE